MDSYTHGGTPPTLWPNRQAHQHTTYFSCGCRRTREYERRVERLAKQVEKLSWMLELMDEWKDINLEEAELKWQYEHASLS